ncbi:MAG: hypothetical protein FWG89_00445 [Treponema sp.]|nr:hypothetical protein [Treponema sp.]
MIEMPAIEGINTQAGKARYPEDTYIDVLRAYRKHIPALLDTLRRRETIEEYTTTVHGIKGASFGICADDAAKQAAALEAAARSGDILFIDTNNGLFIETVSAILRQLDDFLDAIKKPEIDKQTVSEPDPALLKELAEACKHYKVDEMCEVLDKLEAYLYESGGELVEWLREQTDNLEYQAILERLESIVSQ